MGSVLMQGQVKPNLDWTRNKPAEDLTPFQRFVRDEVDWSQSPLGAPSHWSPQLRQIIQLLVAEPGPAVVYWGEPEDAVIIYNEAYVGIIGSKHPSIQGQLARDGLPEIWDSIYSYLRDQLMTGLMKLGDMQEMMLHRNGFLEESYVSFRLMPILSQEDGTFAGSYATVTEHTLDILAERRSDTIRSLASEIRHATSSSSLWKAVVKGLEKAERDIPLAMLYSAGKADPTQIGEMMCVLESYLGIDPEQPALPRRFGLDSSDYKLAKSFRQAAIHGRPMMFSTGTELLPVDLFATNNSCGHDAHCQSVVICPIKSRESDAIEAFLLIGLNPYRPYDLAYQDFVRMIHESITSLYVSQIMLHEQVEATKLLEAEAALARLTMDKQLAAKQAAFENSELKFSRFGSRIPIGIGIADTKGNVLYGNPAWRRFTQVSETSTKPFDFMACCVPDQDDLIRSLWEDLTQGKPVNSYLRLKTLWTSPDNTQEPMTALINAYTDVDQDGEVSMMSCLTDISHSKWIEAQLLQRTAELEQSELKYKNFADLAPVGVCLLGPDRALQYANRSFFSIMAHPTPSRDFMIGIDPRDAELVHNNLANLKSETTFECRLLRGGQMTNGSAAQRSSNTQAETTQAWILVSAYLEREPTTSIVCWVTDITVQKTMQAVTEQRMKEAIETRRQQERFIDMTSHEIRNPLSAMIHCTDEIIENCQQQQDGFVESSLEAAYTIEYCAKHIRNIVGDVLMLSKLDSKLVEVCPVPTRPRDMVQQALKMFSGEARAQDIEVTYKEHDSMQTLGIDWLLLDPNRVLQVLVNLVTNAIKFTRARPIRKILVSLDASLELPSKHPGDISYIPRRLPWSPDLPDGQRDIITPLYLIIMVEDTGLGLTELEKTVLFERFKQASPKTETKYGGSGLGLFISRDLTEIQGGEIGVRSEPGVGSKFVFYVETKRVDAPEHSPMINIPEITMSIRNSPAKSPLAPIVLGSVGTSRETIESPTGAAQAKRLSAGADASRKILVVEDNLVNQKVLAKQLRKRGFDVATAENGEEALKSLFYTHRYRLTTSAFDLVLMDIEMPVMDGIACVREIRAAEAEGKLEGHVPVIAVTANVRAEQTADAWTAGVDDIATKPYRIDELVKKIENICGSALISQKHLLPTL